METTHKISAYRLYDYNEWDNATAFGYKSKITIEADNIVAKIYQVNSNLCLYVQFTHKQLNLLHMWLCKPMFLNGLLKHYLKYSVAQGDFKLILESINFK
ncbi:hypothetical protein LCGC14_0342260 [marine sediment metagenome]|uniref:Uncharacterized protein n=1 Tax=marine sediment metagenome TaxID=412755 RepID=A0A0F9TIX0_9ZZZZ